MGGDLVKQKDGGCTRELGREPRVGQHKAEQQCLLLAGRAACGGHGLRLMAHQHVREMRTFKRPARSTVAAALGTQAQAKVFLHVDCGAAIEDTLDIAGESELSLWEGSFSRALEHGG